MKEVDAKVVKHDPNFKELVKKRTKFAWTLTISILVVYFSFILTIAFSPSLLATPISSNTVTTIGIPIGIFVIVFSFILTGIYVRRANSEFDTLTTKIKENLESSK